MSNKSSVVSVNVNIRLRLIKKDAPYIAICSGAGNEQMVTPSVSDHVGCSEKIRTKLVRYKVSYPISFLHQHYIGIIKLLFLETVVDQS